MKGLRVARVLKKFVASAKNVENCLLAPHGPAQAVREKRII